MDKAEIKVNENLISYLIKHKVYFKNLESDATISIPKILDLYLTEGGGG